MVFFLDLESLIVVIFYKNVQCKKIRLVKVKITIWKVNVNRDRLVMIVYIVATQTLLYTIQPK